MLLTNNQKVIHKKNFKFLCGMTKLNFKRGTGLVEILVAVFIFTVVLGSLIYASNLYLSGAGDNLKSAKAAYLAQEGIEAVRIMRDASWTNISQLTASTTTYYFSWNTSSTTNKTWATTTIATTTDSFTRTFKVYSVYRDANGRIVTSGTLDANTRKVTVSVAWLSKIGTTTKSISTYLANIL